MKNVFISLVVLLLIAPLVGMSQEEVNRTDGFYYSIDYQNGIPNEEVEYSLTPNILIQDIKLVEAEINELGKNVIKIKFNDNGAKLFYEMTLSNLGKPIGIFLDNKIVSSPIVYEPIKNGVVMISGEGNKNEVNKIVTLLSLHIK